MWARYPMQAPGVGMPAPGEPRIGLFWNVSTGKGPSAVQINLNKDGEVHQDGSGAVITERIAAGRR